MSLLEVIINTVYSIHWDALSILVLIMLFFTSIITNQSPLIVISYWIDIVVNFVLDFIYDIIYFIVQIVEITIEVAYEILDGIKSVRNTIKLKISKYICFIIIYYLRKK